MSNFSIESTNVIDCKVVTHKEFGDDRGSFSELFNSVSFGGLMLPTVFKQLNYSSSSYGVLRGLHIQSNFPQGKLVKCLVGEIFDVCVDLRPASPSFKRWFGTLLSAEKNTSLYLPPGTAHGFICTSRVCVIQYLCTTIYDKESDGGVIYSDPELSIDWPIKPRIISDKDKSLPTVEEWLAKERERESIRTQ